MRQHEARGHWPYDKGCDSYVQARGRTPARRRRHEGGDDQSPGLTSMAADFTFVAGKYGRILVILMIHTGMMGMVVITENRKNDIKSIASVLNEIGVGGLNIEVATDNEGLLEGPDQGTDQVQHEILLTGGTSVSTGPRLRGLREPWVLQKKAFTPIGLLLKNTVSVGLSWNLLCLDI